MNSYDTVVAFMYGMVFDVAHTYPSQKLVEQTIAYRSPSIAGATGPSNVIHGAVLRKAEGFP